MIGGAPIFMPAPVYARPPVTYAPGGYPAGSQGRPVAVEARPAASGQAVAVGGPPPVYRGAMGKDPGRPVAKRRAPPAIPTPEELNVTPPRSVPAQRAVAVRRAPVVPTPEEVGVTAPGGSRLAGVTPR
jgi:hypothetical protein